MEEQTVLAKERRENLLPHVKEARRVVEDAFDRALNGLGMFRDRDPLPAERVADPVRLSLRRVVDQVLARDREAGGLSYPEARQRYVEHCAFTLVNRIAALRAMEIRGFLPRTVIAQDAQYGGLSPWARDLLEAGGVEVLGESIAVHTPDEARWQAIRLACETVSHDVGMLFDLRDEYSILAPEPAALKVVLAELTNTVTEADWRADDILGWVYQYYNVSANAAYKVRRKRRGYRMTADDMIVANQFYTPHWVVRVLVDNTLGRIWWESIPDLARLRCGPAATLAEVAAEESRLRQLCRATCAYLVPLPDEQRLGWWGEEALVNAEIRAVEEARKRHGEAGGKPENAPAPPPPSVPARSWKKVRDLKIIDPACGSGHFLLYVFDVLMRMYEVEPPADCPDPVSVPNLILAHNLHGIDVDLRACQLAAFNLYLKARHDYRDATGRDDFHPSGLKIVCAGARVVDGEHRRQLLDSFSANLELQELTEEILNDLSRTAEIGSLLKVRQKFEPLLRRQRMVRGRPHQGSLFGPTDYQGDLFLDTVIEEYTLPQILERLSHFEGEAQPSSDVGRLLFARELAKSCGLVALLSEEYDVLLMNPPYGKMPAACKEYCEGNRRRGIPAHYPRTAHDIYTTFIEQAIDLTLDLGLIGMLTSQTFMFLRTFEEVRSEILNKLAPPDLVLDCEFGVLDGATVGTAASVLRRNPEGLARLDVTRLFIRLWQTAEGAKENGFVEALEALVQGKFDGSTYAGLLDGFAKVAWAPYAYWMSPTVRAIYPRFPPLDRDALSKPASPKLANVKQGLDSGSDPRFVRFFWEVPPHRIASQREDTLSGRPWVPFAKGGWLDEFQADVSCVVQWENDGELIRDYRSPGGRSLSAPRNRGFYFLPGLSWMRSPQMGSILKGQLKRINARILPAGTIITGKVCGVFPQTAGTWDTLGFLNSEIAYFLVRIYSGREMQVATVASLPFPVDKNRDSLGQMARASYNLLLTLRTTVENSPYFAAPAIIQSLHSSTKSIRPVTNHPLAQHFCWPDDPEQMRECPVGAESFANGWRSHGKPSDSLRNLALIAWQRRKSTEEIITDLQLEIDQEMYSLFDIGPEDRVLIAREILLRQKRRPVEEAVEDGNDADNETENEMESEEPLEGNLSSSIGQEDPTPFVRNQVAQLISHAVRTAVEADDDGVISVTQAGAEPTLAEYVKAQVREWFGHDQEEAKWAEAGEILGKPVEEWLAQDYFDFHVNMYRRRPIFWQLTSAYCVTRGVLPGAFSCLVHYHKLQGNTLQNIRAHYVAPALERAQAQYDAARTTSETQERIGVNRRELNRVRRARDEADKRLRELLEFDRRLQDLDTGARPVVPAPGPEDSWVRQKIAEVTGGPHYGRGWLPVIDYGVRVNIEPLKAARILPRAADRIN